MIGRLAFLFSFYFTQAQLFIEVLYSNYTDMSLTAQMSAFLKQTLTDQIELKETLVLNCSESIVRLDETQIVIDLTFSLPLVNCIKDLANQAHFVVISSNTYTESYNDWQFSTHYPNQDHYNALSNLIEFLNWDKFIVVSNIEAQNTYGELEKKFSNKNLNFFNFDDDESEDYVDRLVGKIIKPTGIKNIVILNEGKSAEKLVKSLKKKNVFGLECGIILGSKSLWSIKEDGVLAYVESELENSVDSYSYEILALTKFIKLILEFPGINDSLELKQFLEDNTENHHLKSKFSVINIKNSQKTKVGDIYHELALNGTIIFPGNSTVIPNSPTTNITISVADGVTNPGYTNSSYSVIKTGAKYALSYIKEINFLDGFEILMHHTDCGAEVYSPSFSYNCFSKLKSQLGVGFLTTPAAPTCIGNIISLRRLGISIPHISENAPAPALTDKVAYPEFMRVIKDSRYNTGVLFSLLAVFNWKNIIVFYENSTGPISCYEYLLKMINNTSINIGNDPSERLIKINYRHTDYEQYKPAMVNAINSRIRIFIIFINAPSEFYFIEDFYDTGLRRGDAILLFYLRKAYAIITEPDLTQVKKLMELMYGSIVVDNQDWVGSYGQRLKEEYIKNYGSDIIYRCFSFDAAMLLLNGIKYTIDQGENVEDPAILNANLRALRFVGCSGIVSVDPGSNQRSTSIMSIFILKWNATTNLLYEFSAGKYDLGSVQLIQFYENLIWYDNTTDTPSDTIPYDECPFDKGLEEYSKKGAGILYCISFFIVIVTAGTTFYIWKWWWNVEIPMLTTRSLIKFEDYIAMVMIFIYFLQYLAMGPDIGEYDSYSNNLTSYAIINFHWLTQGKIFWIYVELVIGAVGLWLYFSIHMILRLDTKFVNFFSAYSKTLATIIMPFLGNACFLPIVSVLISVFQCDQSIGDGLTQSFVRNDCNEFCYKNYHLHLAFISLAALVIYLPLAIYFRPFWDNSNDDANIKPRSLFLMVKSLLQVCIIVLNKTVKVYSQSLHGACYILLFSGFLLFCIKKKPYNYDRCNLWSIISYCAIIWSVSLSSLFWILPVKIYSIWVALEYIGWGSMIAFGLYFQQKLYPSLLYSEEAPDITLFFRFSLGSKVLASEINQANRERSDRKNYMSSGNEKTKLKENNQSDVISISNLPENIFFHRPGSLFNQEQENYPLEISSTRKLIGHY
ncbi:unnamed protein product [Blepharisma stoltei]|uniref:Receptor ligand binding region domain-containing protein n=1 Tax=Blepharisma stoltei TaxID=1481888 RepID=A0AAU9KAT4_9CILI|nr:unnamed protein product [Blepharisma stoltei]